MKKNIIRITEQDIYNAIRQVIAESPISTYKDMYDNAVFFSKDEDEFDERMKARKEYADTAAELAKRNHPQATPFRKIWNNGKKEHDASYNSNLYKGELTSTDDFLSYNRKYDKDFLGF